MSGFFALLNIIAIVVFFVFIIKSDKKKKRGEDNSVEKKIWIISLVVFFVAFIMVGVLTPSTPKEENGEGAEENETTESQSSEDATSEEENAEETANNPTELIVSLNTMAKWDGSSAVFEITTNLPDETELMLTLSSGDYNTDDKWMGQNKVIIKDGKAESDGFSNKGNKLDGDYDLKITMSLPQLQSDAVRSIIGENGENMTGEFVDDSVVGESKTVSALYSVSFGDEIGVSPEDDYTHTIFSTDESDDTSSKTVDSNTDEEIVNALIAATEYTLKDSFGDNYNIAYEDNVVTINLWQSGITAGALGVKAGTVSKKEWEAMVAGVQSMANSTYKAYEPYGITVNVNVLNDVNKDNTLLSFINGVKFYDVIEQ